VKVGARVPFGLGSSAGTMVLVPVLSRYVMDTPLAAVRSAAPSLGRLQTIADAMHQHDSPAPFAHDGGVKHRQAAVHASTSVAVSAAQAGSGQACHYGRARLQSMQVHIAGRYSITMALHRPASEQRRYKETGDAV